MKEYVGNCCCCGKEVFCMDGFFMGNYTKDKKIICLDCQFIMEKKKNPQN